jgi:hypothetical protein
MAQDLQTEFPDIAGFSLADRRYPDVEGTRHQILWRPKVLADSCLDKSGLACRSNRQNVDSAEQGPICAAFSAINTDGLEVLAG